jgi:hypothetical protein
LAAAETAAFALRPERYGRLAHLSDGLPMLAGARARKLPLVVAERLGGLSALELDGAVRRQEAGCVRALRPGEERA